MKKIPNEVFLARACHGWLSIRNENYGFKKRWFFMMSQRPLEQEYEDGVILSSTKLPSWMEFNTIYIFSMSNNND